MRIYLVWQKDRKNVAIMDISKIIEDVRKEQPELDTVITANAVMDLAEADFIMTAEDEEQMLEHFPNAEIKYDKEMH